MSVYLINLIDPRNVGDRASSPINYYGFGKGAIHLDLKSDAAQQLRTTRNDVIVYGGGAIGHPAARHASRQKAYKIAWGVGVAGNAQANYKAFDLAGVRDWPPPRGTRWVPCVSCMSPLFDDPAPPTKDLVMYGHARKRPLAGLNNDAKDLRQVLTYLSQGETIVTSSYHGVYWATLLGRAVVALPFGPKFHRLKHKPTIAEDYNGQAGTIHREALAECRAQNIGFWEEVVARTAVAL